MVTNRPSRLDLLLSHNLSFFIISPQPLPPSPSTFCFLSSCLLSRSSSRRASRATLRRPNSLQSIVMLLPKRSLPPARSGLTSVRAGSTPSLHSTSCSSYTLHRFSVSGPRCRRRGCLRYRLFCRPSPNRQKGRDQEDCPLRPFDVLSEDSPGVEVAQIPQRGRRMRKCKPLINDIRVCPLLIRVECRSSRF